MEELVIESHSVDYWRDIISDFLVGHYSTHNYRLKFGNLYRARNFKSKSIEDVLVELGNIKALWAPPRRFASKGRCNVKGIPILYVSPMVRPLIFELNIGEGDLFAVVKYDVKDYIQPVSVAGVQSLMSCNDGLNEILANHLLNRSPDCLELDDFISKVFQMSNGMGVDIYNITIALTQIFWNKPSKKLIGQQGVSPTAIGMMYPSVATESIYPNLAFKPKEVKDIIVPVEVHLYRLEQCLDYRNILLTEIAKAERISDNGEVKWKRTFKKAVQLVDENGKFNRFDYRPFNRDHYEQE